MAQASLYGWDATNEVWRKLICNEDGKLIIDPTEIFEDEPTDNEHGKAPTSNWAHDHAVDEDAHHSKTTAAELQHNDLAGIGPNDHHEKYTDTEVRAAIGNLISSTGILAKKLHCAFYGIENLPRLDFRTGFGDTCVKTILPKTSTGEFLIFTNLLGTGYIPTYVKVHNGSVYETLATEPVVDSKIATHAADEDAHHAKYTDAEAQAACKLSGDVYHSLPGCAFIPVDPLADIVSYDYLDGFITLEADNKNIIAPVHLPDGVTVKSVLFEGNAAAEDSYVMLRRLHLSTHNAADMAIGQVGDEITTIYNSVIDNQNYVYFLGISSLKTNDIIYGARIKYNL